MRYARSGLTETTLRPVDIIRETYCDVARALEAANVEFWLISSETDAESRVGVHQKDRNRVAAALRELGHRGYWVGDALASGLLVRDRPLSSDESRTLLASCDILAVFKPRLFGSSELVLTTEYCCEIEFWATEVARGREYARAPRANRASDILGAADFSLEAAVWHGVPVMRPAALGRRMLDDICFDIDVVYTWVDGTDPAWRAKRDSIDAPGETYHPEAMMESRFIHRDELRYSLRSLDYFAPWVRKVFLVTDQQVPSWLNLENPRLEVVDHQDIFTDRGYLPCFNSNSIISNLHHIDGLAEHYLYMNDDVFLGRWTTPDLFFLPTGVAKVSPSDNRRMFGDPRPEDEPHFNITRNIRRILEDEFGVTVSRAIRHTPHPQRRSVHYEMEERFASHYSRTWGHKFRHHTDIVADQLHHYYAQITGRAVPERIPYTYINVMDSRRAGRLNTVLAQRQYTAFCLNDSPVAGIDPIEPGLIHDFLDHYFPLPSSFER